MAIGDGIHQGPKKILKWLLSFFSWKWRVYGTRGQERKAVMRTLEMVLLQPQIPKSMEQDKII